MKSAIVPESVSYFHGKVTREQAEDLLLSRGADEGLFLLRASAGGNYAVSICHHGRVHHYNVERQPDDSFQIPTGRKFIGPVELVHHHAEHLDGFLTLARVPLERGHGDPLLIMQGVDRDNFEELLRLKAAEMHLKGPSIDEALSGPMRDHFSHLVLKDLHVTQPWYHDAIKRIDADDRLAEAGNANGNFLVRHRKEDDSFVLSLSFNGEPKHYKIEKRMNKLSIEGGKFFDTVMELIDHYHFRQDGLLCKLKRAISASESSRPRSGRSSLSSRSSVSGANSPNKQWGKATPPSTVNNTNSSCPTPHTALTSSTTSSDATPQPPTPLQVAHSPPWPSQHNNKAATPGGGNTSWAQFSTQPSATDLISFADWPNVTSLLSNQNAVVPVSTNTSTPFSTQLANSLNLHTTCATTGMNTTHLPFQHLNTGNQFPQQQHPTSAFHQGLGMQWPGIGSGTQSVFVPPPRANTGGRLPTSINSPFQQPNSNNHHHSGGTGFQAFQPPAPSLQMLQQASQGKTAQPVEGSDHLLDLPPESLNFPPIIDEPWEEPDGSEDHMGGTGSSGGSASAGGTSISTTPSSTGSSSGMAMTTSGSNSSAGSNNLGGHTNFTNSNNTSTTIVAPPAITSGHMTTGNSGPPSTSNFLEAFLSDEAQLIYDALPRNDVTFNLKREQLQLKEKLGGGNFGCVVKGLYKPPDENSDVPVAVKMLKEDQTQAGEHEILVEARNMSRLKHRNIVRLIGVCKDLQVMLVLELAPLGPINKYLRKHQDTSVPVITDLMMQVAQGMAYLESSKFVHRDLAARNVLLVNKNFAKISDFGMSKALNFGNDYYRAATAGKWPLKWYAPECIYYFRFDSKSDVWSYGVTLWEAYSYGERPYKDMKGTQILAMLDQGLRLSKPPRCPDAAYEVMRQCWHAEGVRRPTFAELVLNMSRVLASLGNNSHHASNQNQPMPQPIKTVSCQQSSQQRIGTGVGNRIGGGGAFLPPGGPGNSIFF